MSDLEAIARAIHFRGEDQGDDAWNHCQPHLRTMAREQAAAALRAIDPSSADALAEVRSAVIEAIYGKRVERSEPTIEFVRALIAVAASCLEATKE